MSQAKEQAYMLDPLPVKGYTEQHQDNVDAVNRNKEMEETILRILDAMAQHDSIDKRWLAIGRTHIEQGFMAINRSIFKPERITLDKDAIPSE